MPPRPPFAVDVLSATAGRDGLEIGGPSAAVFGRRGILPVYAGVGSLDNVNFASETAWESGLRDGAATFQFDPARPAGRQFLREATALHGMPDAGYDFILSSHCLEHLANPLAALREWRRVIRPGGNCILILPDPRRTFDCRRPVTSFAHLREDEAQGRGEDDLSHLEEILRLHDLSRDPHAGSPEQFATRARQNPANRCLHHHVFDLSLMRSVLEETGWHPIALAAIRPLHLVAFAETTRS